MRPLPIRIDRESSVPLHNQLAAQLQHLIRCGDLRTSEQLPTVRHLGRALGVNRNTVQKVYSGLERAGLLETSTGRGTYVAARPAADADRARQRAQQRLRAAIQEGLDLGLNESEIMAAAQLEVTRISMERARQAVGLAASRQRFATWGRYGE